MPYPKKKRKKSVGYDVFLCHNSLDKPAVARIARELKRRRVIPWLDEWELRPGVPILQAIERLIPSVHSAAVIVGGNGVGPWQDVEIYAFLTECVRRQIPVIPVLLPGSPDPPDLPVMLRGRSWVDFRNSWQGAMSKLIWGITGKRRP